MKNGATHWEHTTDGWEVRALSEDLGFDRKIEPAPCLEQALRWTCGLTLLTNEAWGATFSGGRLKLRVVEHGDGISVYVSGNDDFSMSRDCAGREEAEAVIRRLPVPITQVALQHQGFGYN